MPIFFKDAPEDISFEYYDQLPTNNVKRKINITALYLYGLYRNTVYDSYKEKADLAIDIKQRKNVYQEKDESQLTTSQLYKSPLYHYSVGTSLGAIKEWHDSQGKMKCYVAYKHNHKHRIKIGFVHFIEQKINDKPIIYIAQAGVANRGHGIGRHLMECVLMHYPVGTEFYILTRVFNTEAKNLYQKRLGFAEINANEVQQLGLDSRYCGFKHITTDQALNEIKNQVVSSDNTLKSNYRFRHKYLHHTEI